MVILNILNDTYHELFKILYIYMYIMITSFSEFTGKTKYLCPESSFLFFINFHLDGSRIWK